METNTLQKQVQVKLSPLKKITVSVGINCYACTVIACENWTLYIIQRGSHQSLYTYTMKWQTKYCATLLFNRNIRSSSVEEEAKKKLNKYPSVHLHTYTNCVSFYVYWGKNLHITIFQTDALKQIDFFPVWFFFEVFGKYISFDVLPMKGWW